MFGLLCGALRARGVRVSDTDRALGTGGHQGSLMALLALGLPHPASPSRQEKEHKFLRQCCSQGTIAIHHSPPEKCKYALADSGIIYYPRPQRGCEQARLLAKPCSRFPWEARLGGQSWGVGGRREAEAGAPAAENRAGPRHRGWSGGGPHLGTRFLESVHV